MPIFVACRGRPFCRPGHAGKNKYDLEKTTRHLVEITKHLETNCRLPDFAEKARYPARGGDKAKEEAADARLPPFGLLQRYDIFRRKANRPLRVLTFGRTRCCAGGAGAGIAPGNRAGMVMGRAAGVAGVGCGVTGERKWLKMMGIRSHGCALEPLLYTEM